MNQRRVYSLVIQLATTTCLLITCSSLSAQNLLLDPSFEGIIVYDASVAAGGWVGFSSTAGTMSGAGFGSGAARSGFQQTTLFTSGAGHYAGVFEDVPVAAGSKVQFSIWHQDVLGSNGQGIEMRFEYRNSVSHSEVGRTANFKPASLGPDYAPFSMMGVVPGNADTVRAVYAIQSFSGPANQRLYLDDASLVVIPEPTSAALLGIAVIGSCRRRSHTT